MAKCRQITIRTIFIAVILLVSVFAGIAGYSYADSDSEGNRTGTAVIKGPDHIERMAKDGNFGLESYGVESDVRLIYSSSDENVAFVDTGGYVQLRSAGEAEITVQTADGTAEKKITLTIIKTKPLRIELFCGNEVEGTDRYHLQPDANYHYFYAYYDQPYSIEAVSPIFDLHYEAVTPDIVNIDENGRMTFNSTGDCRILITTDENELYYGAEFRVGLQITKYSPKMFFELEDISAKVSEGGCRLQLVSTPGLTVDFSSSASDIADVDSSGYVTFHKAGTVTIFAVSEETEHYRQSKCIAKISIAEDRKPQQITGEVPSEIGIGQELDLNLNLSASTGLSYKSSNTSAASVSEDGIVHFLKAGNVTITATADGNSEYQGTTRNITINVRDYDAEAKAKAAAEAKKQEDARKKAAAAAEAKRQAAAAAAKMRYAADKAKADTLAKSLKKPKLKCTRKKGKNKLSWNKVKGASGYELYVKYPGQTKYELAVTRGASIKSVTHKGLTRKRKYSYKLRAYVQVGKARSYGPFSKVKTAKVK